MPAQMGRAPVGKDSGFPPPDLQMISLNEILMVYTLLVPHLIGTNLKWAI